MQLCIESSLEHNRFEIQAVSQYDYLGYFLLYVCMYVYPRTRVTRNIYL